MSYLFTSESVSEGHPDKVADQISDAIIDHYLAFDPNSKVACETLVTTGQVILAGEVKSNIHLEVQEIARNVIEQIGYNQSSYRFEANTCGILSAIHDQSEDISQGVEREHPEDQGAGDQGMMFGYASSETQNYMPLPLELAHRILRVLSEIRKEGKAISYLGPDSKSQVTVEYGDDNRPKGIETIVISTQHHEFDSDEKMRKQIQRDLKEVVMPRVIDGLSEEVRALFDDDINYLINPTGRFVTGGPHGDTGLTGRKIIVDTYGGKGAHGGGAFSGKDPSKVDRSAAYATRHIAKNMVASGLCNEALVQVSYAIGEADPCGVYVNTYNSSVKNLTDSEIAKRLQEMISLRPFHIEQRLKLRKPIYQETASYGHMGRDHRKTLKKFVNGTNRLETEVELFTWEKLDLVDELRDAFGL